MSDLIDRQIEKDWRKALQYDIEEVAQKIHDNAEKLANQPDYMIDKFEIHIEITADSIPTYKVIHTHF